MKDRRPELPVIRSELALALADDSVRHEGQAPATVAKYDQNLKIFNEYVALRVEGRRMKGMEPDLGSLPTPDEEREWPAVAIQNSAPLVAMVKYITSRREDVSAVVGQIMTMLSRDGALKDLSHFQVQDILAMSSDFEKREVTDRCELPSIERLVRDGNFNDYTAVCYATQCGLRQVSHENVAPCDLNFTADRVVLTVERDKVRKVAGREIGLHCVCLSPVRLAEERRKWLEYAPSANKKGLVPSSSSSSSSSSVSLAAERTSRCWDIASHGKSVYCFVHNAPLRRNLKKLSQDFPKFSNAVKWLDKIGKRYGASGSKGFRGAYAAAVLREEREAKGKFCAECCSSRQGWEDPKKFLVYGGSILAEGSKWLLPVFAEGENCKCRRRVTLYDYLAMRPEGSSLPKNSVPIHKVRRVTADEKANGIIRRLARGNKSMFFPPTENDEQKRQKVSGEETVVVKKR